MFTKLKKKIMKKLNRFFFSTFQKVGETKIGYEGGYLIPSVRGEPPANKFAPIEFIFVSLRRLTKSR